MSARRRPGARAQPEPPTGVADRPAASADERAISADAVLSARFRHRVAMRFRDLDPMGHAHHTLPLIYVEEARAEYWREVVGRRSLADIDYVIGEVRVRYHARMDWPANVDVALRVAHIGTKSLQMAFLLTSPDGGVLASGETTQVMYDFAEGHTMAVPADVRAAIEAYERGTRDQENT